MSGSVPYIHRDERPVLHAYKYSRHSDNPHCLDQVLDFMETEFGLLPVESPGESIVFLPQFVALVGTALWDTSIWVSLFGEPHEFDGDDTVAGQYPSWRKFHVQNRDEDLTRAKDLIRQARANYSRKQGSDDWEELVSRSEKRWLDKRMRERIQANMQRLLRDL